VSEPDHTPTGFAERIGAEFLDLDPDGARARIAVEPHHLQPFGIVHGGVYPALAETLTSTATWFAVNERGMVPLGQSNSVSLMRPITGGHVNARAVARHRGRTTWVWDVEISDDEERLCALVRMTLAIRPERPPGHTT
jgi:1,4-dihydroxy-2-naphthoyl-CoA hydrolase